MADEILTETEQVAILAQPAPGAVIAFRNEDPATREGALYSRHTGMEGVIPDTYFEGADMPADKRAAAVQNLRSMFADLGVVPAEAQQMLNRASAARADGKTDEQARKEARIELTKVFGKEGADQALDDAKKLIYRDPRLAKWMGKKGLGNDAETIIQLARAANSQRMAGRLK